MMPTDQEELKNAGMYRDFILDHYKSPRNQGIIEKADIHYHDSNPLCGDELDIYLDVKDGIVKDIKFTGKGCAISQASMSMLSEIVKGKTLKKLLALDKKEVLDMLGIELSVSRVKCALLGLTTVKKGIVQHGGENEVS